MMDAVVNLKVNKYQVLFFFLAAILCTVLRISLLLISPFLIFFLISYFRFVFRPSLLILAGLGIVAYLLSFFNGFYFRYNILSFFYIIPFLCFLFVKPGRKTAYDNNYFHSFMKWVAILTVVNNLIGIVQYAKNPGDDNFQGIYGHFTVTQNALVIINSVLCFYYFRLYTYYKEKKHLWLSLFFVLGTVLGFYGGGLMVFFVALFLSMVRFNIVKVLQVALIAVLALIIVYQTIKVIAPKTLEYNIAVLERFKGAEGQPVPRKILSYKNYYNGYTSDTKDLLFGSGPGTFNSRSAFVIGSPDYFTPATPFKSEVQPYYFEHYAYTLWNKYNVIQYSDGFMNQPFSSMLALLGEYGLLFTLLFLLAYYNQYKSVTRHAVHTPDKKLAKDVFKFTTIYLLGLLIIDNYAEYPEISILLILIMKFAEIELSHPPIAKTRQA